MHLSHTFEPHAPEPRGDPRVQRLWDAQAMITRTESADGPGTVQFWQLPQDVMDFWFWAVQGEGYADRHATGTQQKYLTHQELSPLEHAQLEAWYLEYLDLPDDRRGRHAA